MRESLSLPTKTAAMLPPPRPGVRPLLTEDHDRIAAGLTDIAVRRLFSAGLSLETVVALMGDHRAAGTVRQAIGELDLAIRDLRQMMFDHYRPVPPAARR